MTKFKKAIILVAGRGMRMRSLTNKIPKCLIKINNKTILMNALDALEKNNLQEAVLVVGYLKNKIKQEIGGKFGNMNIRYVENDAYDKRSTSHSLWLALQKLHEEVIMLEGDVFFEEELLRKFIRNSNPDSTIVGKYNPNLDGSFVEVQDKIIIDWIHKNRRPADFTIEDKFKTVNIHKFSSKFLGDILKPFLEKHIKENSGVEPIEYVLQDIVKNKHKINAFESENLKWFEIDTPEELKIAREMFK